MGESCTGEKVMEFDWGLTRGGLAGLILKGFVGFGGGLGFRIVGFGLGYLV